MVHVLDMEDKEDSKLTKNDDSSESDEKPVVKPVEKKPRSQKQIDAFKNAQINRAKSIQLKKDTQKIEAAKLILKQEPVKPEPKKTKKVVVDSSSEEEEVIIVEKRKKKTKPKRIIVEESESEEEVVPREKTFKSQQNKRSININAKSVPAPTTVFFV
jgi:hypothetical protein